MFSYGLKEEYKMKKKVDVTYYRMHYNDVIGALFTNGARKKIYFKDETSNNLYYLTNGKKVITPLIYSKDLFAKCVLSLYPIGAYISDKNNINVCGEIVYYEMETNVYVIKFNSCNYSTINFNDAIIVNYYYFISSVGKIQRDVVGRDEKVERFRKATNNYFENKEDVEKKIRELFVYLE